MKKYLLVILIILFYQTAASAKESNIMRAMEDELTRSMKELKLDDRERPYYISYLVKDTYSMNITADSGGITSSSENQNKTVTVDLRVGDYTLDNTNFMSTSSSSPYPLNQDDDYDIMRMCIWSATDIAYNAALERLSQKKGALQNIVQEEVLPDFTKGETTSHINPEASFSLDKKQWESFVDQLSRLFLKKKQIQKSKVSLNIQITNNYYINSEGTKVIEPAAISQLLITAMTQADDGMPLGNLLQFAASDPEELPEFKKLKVDVNKMIDELLITRNAPVAEDYNGPILFVGQASGELFGQGVGKYLLGRRVPLGNPTQYNSTLESRMGNPFLSKVNRRVAAKFLSMSATPTLKSYNGKSLPGSYEVDEQGVKGMDVSLIENGMLKNLLTTRVPVKGFHRSNGHSRGSSPALSVIHVKSTNQLTPEKLKQELINSISDEGLPYGYMVKGIVPPFAEDEMKEPEDIISSLMIRPQSNSDPTQFNLTKPYSICRIYPDGREEPVRGIEFRSHSINILKKILATSTDEIVYNFPATSSGASSILRLLGGRAGLSSQYYATVITPSLLISEIDLKRSSGNFSKLPILAYPVK